MKKTTLAVCAVLAGLTAHGEITLDGGVDLRVRQELYENIAGLPGGGVLSKARRSGFVDQMRIRPRIWGEVKLTTENGAKWRLYTRLADEFRWNPEGAGNAMTFPGELYLDNLYLEGKGLFDGLLDLSVGRRDLMGYCGLNRIFADGTPGDGSRSLYSDMITARFNFSQHRKLDLFFLYNADDNVLRWGTNRSKHRGQSGIAAGVTPEMDDWGWGAIWSDRYSDWLDWQLMAMQKVTDSWHDKSGGKHPWTRRELFGFRLMPKLGNGFSLDFDGMVQVGRNGDGDALLAWSAYAGALWKSEREGWRPFANIGLHFMSGDADAATEDGGHSAWDPMWNRGANESEQFVYGTLYGVGWWSNQFYLKSEAGVEFGRSHSLTGSTGPIFAAVKDGLGGGDGAFKGLLSRVRYSFPIILPDRDKKERLAIFGHVIAEFFNPGDYYETDKPAWFFRWQLEFQF